MRLSSLRQPSILPGFGLTLGFSTFFLSALVLMPLAALVAKTASMGWEDFTRVLFAPRSVAFVSLELRCGAVRGVLNSVFGFVIAWTLVRYEFPGRKLIDALIDMPFALPTAVSGIALTAVFAENGFLGQHLATLGIKVAYTPIGIVVALTLIGLPFVVRSVQPALQEVQRDLEDAAETLGAGRFYIFRRIILPTVFPALATGFTLAFARAVGEYGSVIFIAGNLPFKTEITPLLIVIKLDEFQYAQAAALGFIMLVMSFVMLLSINLLQAWGRKRLVAAER
ncbi:MAG: sulfate ABC transporter permease subunit CysT [Gammaproteobacteria bacterium]|nr:sulfate ABC transporter permease subunit CysT [Gammaproteobacteria bacterium]